MSFTRTLIQLGAWSKFRTVRQWSARRMLAEAPPADLPENSIRVVFGGDVNFDPTIRRMWNLGLHRVRSYNGQRTVAEKVRRKLWHRIVRPVLSAEYSSGVQYMDFDELSIRKPTNALHRVPDGFADGIRPAEV